VNAARPSQFLDRQPRVPGVEEQGIDLRSDALRLGQRLLPGHVDDLDEPDAGQRAAEDGVPSVLEAVAELDRTRPRPALLVGDPLRVAEAGQKHAQHRGRNVRRDLGDPLLRDRAEPAWHAGDEPDRRGAGLDGEPDFLRRLHAADLHLGQSPARHRSPSPFPSGSLKARTCPSRSSA